MLGGQVGRGVGGAGISGRSPGSVELGGTGVSPYSHTHHNHEAFKNTVMLL